MEIRGLDYSDSYILRITIFDTGFVINPEFKEFVTNLVNTTLPAFYKYVVETSRRRMISQYQLDIEQPEQYNENGVEFAIALESPVETVSNENDQRLISQLKKPLNDTYNQFDVEIIREEEGNVGTESSLDTLLTNPYILVACIAIILLLCTIAILVFCLWRKAKQRGTENKLEENISKIQDIEMQEMGTETTEARDDKEIVGVDSVSMNDTCTQISSNFNETQSNHTFNSLSDIRGNKMMEPGNINNINHVNIDTIDNYIASDLSSSSDSMMEDAYDVHITTTSNTTTTQH